MILKLSKLVGFGILSHVHSITPEPIPMESQYEGATLSESS